MNIRSCTLRLISILLIAHSSLYCTEIVADTQSQSHDVIGDWTGILQIPNGKLTLWLSMSRNAENVLFATLESPDQAPGKKWL